MAGGASRGGGSSSINLPLEDDYMPSYDNEQPSLFAGVHGYHMEEQLPDQTTLYDMDSCFPVSDNVMEDGNSQVTLHKK